MFLPSLTLVLMKGGGVVSIQLFKEFKERVDGINPPPYPIKTGQIQPPIKTKVNSPFFFFFILDIAFCSRQYYNTVLQAFKNLYHMSYY